MYLRQDAIQKELKYQKACLSKYQSVLNELPPGELQSYGSKGHIYYRVRNGEQRYSISVKDKAKLELFKFKMLLLDMCGILENNILQLESVRSIRTFDPNILMENPGCIYHDLPGKYISETGFVSASEWAEVYVPPREKYKEEHKYPTLSGYKVCSTHEQYIMDFYWRMKIPTRYEPKVVLNSGAELFPDFEPFARKLNRSIYHEHAGKISAGSYQGTYLWKQKEYLFAGLIPDEDYFFTYGRRDKTMDQQQVEGIIRLHLF